MPFKTGRDAETELSNKLQVNVRPIIQAWKKGKEDWEISQSLGVDFLTLETLRSELLRRRQAQRATRLLDRLLPPSATP